MILLFLGYQRVMDGQTDGQTRRLWLSRALAWQSAPKTLNRVQNIIHIRKTLLVIHTCCVTDA